MKIKVSELVRRVYDLLDENQAILEERVEYCDPDTMLKPLIIDLLPDAARIVINSAPLSKIDDCLRLTDLKTELDGVTVAALPENFLRLVHIRMSDWDYGVTVPMIYGGEEHQLRMRQRAGRTAPAVAVRCRGKNKWLEIYGSGSGAAVASLDYAPIPEITGKYMDLPPSLISQVCAKTAEMIEHIIK